MSALVLLAPLLLAQDSPTSAGGSLEAVQLEALGAVVQRWADEERIVGAELAVLRGETVLFHRGFGWRHREERVPMEPGGIFCLRSMTKPIVGAAIQMLIDEGRLAPSDAVARHLPAFDHEDSRAITIEQLLTHTGGLGLSSLVGRDLAAFTGERALAELIGHEGPAHAPGAGFHYSDDGADVLGALVELVSELELEAFLRARLFEPLGLDDMAGVMTREHPLRARLCSAYAGGPGAWTRYFGPADPPLFPFLLGSQGLYGSVRDYARFLSLWQGDGIAGGQRLLSERAVRAALRPAQHRTTPTGFAGLQSAYGEMMALWVDPAAVEERRVVAFGHGGSDGTAAWLFPAHDLTVLYFTQSRNTRTVIELEGELQRLVLDPLEGRAVRPAISYTEEQLGPFTGEYWEEDEQDFRVVLLQEGRLWLEYPGRTRIELAPTSVADAFAYTLAPDLRLEFVRDDRGAIVAFDHRRNGQVERLPRLVPAADLPDVAALLARVRATLGAQHLAALGPLRVTGRFEMPALRLDGRYQALADGIRRLKSEIDYGSATEWAVLDGGQGWRQVPGAAREQLDAEQVHELLADHPLLVAADWQALYAHVRVLARGAHAGRPAYLVRAEPRAGCAHDWIVDAESSLPVALRTFSGVAGLGLLGAVTELSDWREVGGVRLPFRRAGRFSNRVLGAFETRWESAEAGVTLPEAAFEPPADAPEEAQEPRQAR